MALVDGISTPISELPLLKVALLNARFSRHHKTLANVKPTVSPAPLQMANPSSWVPHVEAFVDSSRPSNQQVHLLSSRSNPLSSDASLDAITALVKKDILTIEELVRGMELYLTTSDNVLRARGILLLAELVTRLILKPLDNATIHSLIGFFTSRLADWQALRGALIGCLALLRRKSSVGKVLTSDARILAKSYLQNLQVQSLAQHDRKGGDLIYGICEAIDEEKDPHCLLLTFHLVEVLGRLFPDPSGPLAGYARDLFEILGRYFPIYFTHTKPDELDIKRDDLSVALMNPYPQHAFSSTPFFEPFAIPLLLEKLSSSLPLAKLDSLKYLNNCILHYGADRMLKHANAIWSSLREVIFASSQEPLSLLASELLADVTAPENEVAKGALLCLQRLMFQLGASGDNMFVGLIIDDKELETVFSYFITGNNYKDSTAESKQKLYAVASVLSVSTKVSSVCCSRVFQKYFPHLMDTLGISSMASSNCISNGNYVLTKRTNTGALYLCVELLAACKVLAASSEGVSPQSPSGKETWFCFLQKFSGPLVDALGSMLANTGSQGAEEADVLCAVKGLQILATFPESFVLTSNAVYENILTILVSIVIRRWDEKFLWKLALKALTQIGTSIEKFDDSQKGKSYANIVVEKIISLLSFDDSDAYLPLKLEAICDIGTMGLHFMLKVVQGLEKAISTNFAVASVDGNVKFDEHGGFEEVAMRFVINIWDLLDNSTTFNIGAKGQESMLSGVVELDGSNCTQNLISLPSRDEWLISLFASVVIALHPQTPLPEVRVVVEFFWMFMLLKGHIPAAQALGSVINKWGIKVKTTEASNSFSLEEAVDVILNMGPQSFVDNNPSRQCDSFYGSMDIAHSLHAIVCSNFLVQTNAIVGMSWIGKGLAMRGHEKVKEITMLLLKCVMLDCKTRTMALQQDVLEGTAGQETQLLARAAADAFHVLLGDSEVIPLLLNGIAVLSLDVLNKDLIYSLLLVLSGILMNENDKGSSMVLQAISKALDDPKRSVRQEAARCRQAWLEELPWLGIKDLPEAAEL
ncbi:hypothetical protein ACLOJK_040119, partial [Asimina triloba]